MNRLKSRAWTGAGRNLAISKVILAVCVLLGTVAVKGRSVIRMFGKANGFNFCNLIESRRNLLKKRALLIAGLWVPLLLGCEKELKEHPLPQSMKQKIIKQNDPALKAKVISGTVTLAAEHENALPDQARLFIIARPEGVEGGPPLAARRHSRVQLPFDYSIGPADVMLEGNQFDGSIRITARLDQDGNAKASPGDIEGDIVAQAGDKQVNIVLNRIVEGKKSSVTGTLRLDPSVAKDLPDNWKLFLIARAHGQEQGIPIAVKRLEAVEFPHNFSLGTQDVMMPGAEFTGTMSLTARIDRDGDARAGPGDIVGQQIVQAGDENVEVVLKHIVTQ